MTRSAGRQGWVADLAPVSDGGEGFVEALGGANRTSRVTGPLGRTVEAAWLLRGPDAFVETASASGLSLAGGAEANDPVKATSRGTGELVSAAVSAGATRVVVGLGGSACTDGGLGCYEVLHDEPSLAGVQLVGACDVMVPFASALQFAAQKGAAESQRRLLQQRLARVADRYEREANVDVRSIPGAGAAGGLGGAIAALGGTLVAGIEVVADAIGLEDRLASADLVVTGEGLLDAHSFDGKAVGWILDRAAAARVPVLVIVGDQEPDCMPEWVPAQDLEVVSLVERYGRERARSNTLECIEAVVEGYLALMRRSP